MLSYEPSASITDLSTQIATSHHLESPCIAGNRCIELGAGVGLVGLALATLGAQVTLTDKPALLSLLRGNVAKNWLGERPPPG